MPSCRSISDPFDRSLCRYLVGQGDVREDGLDEGVETFHHEGDRFIRHIGGRSDRNLAPELYSVALLRAQTDRRAWDFVRRGREIPWVHHDSSPRGREETQLVRWIRDEDSKINRDLFQMGFRQCDFDYVAAKARLLFEAMIRPVSLGGLGLRFDTQETGPLRDVVGVYRDRIANCEEFVVLFLMAADLCGIPALPIELFQDAAGNPQLHLRIGIQNPQTGEIEFVADLANGFFGRPSQGEAAVTLTRLEMLSYYYNLKGAREPNPLRAASFINFAYRLNPGNYLTLCNEAYYRARGGALREAKGLLLQSITNYPHYPPAYWNLRVIAERLGDQTLSQWALQRSSL